MRYGDRGSYLALALFIAAPAAPETGEQVLHEMLEAHGGLERFHAIEDWHIVAERQLSGDGPITDETYTEYMSRANGRIKTLLIKHRSSEALVYGHDGERGFSLVDGEQRTSSEAEEEGYYRAHGEYYLRAIPFKWADPGVSVRDLGLMDNGDRYLEVRADEGVGRDASDVWVAVIDPSTYLLREGRLTHRGGREIVYRYSDYREVSGLKIPFRLEYWSGGKRTGVNVIQRIAIDAGLSDELFSPDAHHR
jgi:hypothetical protein